MYNPATESYFTVTFSARSPASDSKAPSGMSRAVAFSVNAIIRDSFFPQLVNFDCIIINCRDYLVYKDNNDVNRQHMPTAWRTNAHYHEWPWRRLYTLHCSAPIWPLHVQPVPCSCSVVLSYSAVVCVCLCVCVYMLVGTKCPHKESNIWQFWLVPMRKTALKKNQNTITAAFYLKEKQTNKQ